MADFIGLIFLVLLVLWLNWERGYRRGYIRLRVGTFYSMQSIGGAVVEKLEARGKVASYEGNEIVWIDGVHYRITKSRF